MNIKYILLLSVFMGILLIGFIVIPDHVTTFPAATFPEPATITVLLVGGLAAVISRKKQEGK
jgi:hypothetical protein